MNKTETPLTLLASPSCAPQTGACGAPSRPTSKHLDGYLGRFDLKDESKERITERVKALLARIEEEPKTFGWKMRAKIGDRKRWYELPEEVDGGP